MEKTSESLISLINQVDKLSYQHWLYNEVFTWQWWTLIAVFIVCWITGIKFIERQKRFQILAFGLLVSIISLVLDLWGSGKALWLYRINVLPSIPALLPTDLGVMPVSLMLLYQYFKKWSSFIFFIVAVAFVFSFIFEPLLTWMNIYKVLRWEYYYSFPIYIAMGIACKLLFSRIEKNLGNAGQN